jgi:MFS family permease
VRELRLWPRGGLWRHPDFLRLWSAQTISQFGSQVSQLALPLAAILVLDASAFEVALLGTVEFLPFLLFALPAGVWVDRLPRKPILVLGDVGRAVALASIPLAYAFDALTIWQLYVVGFVVGVCTVFFDVAYQSYLPSLVDRAQLVDGNSKLEVSRSAAALAGPGLAGVLIGALTAPYAILLDAISFVWSAGLLFRIRTEEIVPAPTETPSMRRKLGEGLRYLLGHRF